MNMKTISYLSIILFVFLSLSACTAENHLNEAIKHAEAAMKADSSSSIAKHADEAKTHANAAKGDKNLSPTSGQHLDAGIMSLDQAIEKGKLDAKDSAKQAAEDAVAHFKEVTK